MNNNTARRALKVACASYLTACDGAGPAARGWFVTRGAKVRCWLGATATEAVAKLNFEEKRSVERAGIAI